MDYNLWNTCILVPGFSRSECASWVQAWGSIGAIAGAVWIGLWNDRRALRIRRVLAIRKARSFAASLSAAAERVIEKAHVNDLREYRAALALIDEFLIDGRTIEQELLTLKWSAAVSALRSIGAQMSAFLRAITPAQITGGHADRVARLFKEYHTKIEEQVEVVRHAHPGVPINYQEAL